MSWRDAPTTLVARREIKDATGAKSFRITLVISALAIVALIVIANLTGGDDTRQVVIAGPDATSTVEPIGRLGAAIGVDLDVSAVPDDDAAVAAVRDGEADLAILAGASRLVTEEPVDLADGSTLASLVNVVRAELALETGLRDAGLTAEDAAAVRTTAPPPVESLRAGDEGVDSSRIGVATVTNILLFLLLQMYGQWVITGVTREKASRVVEVLLAIVRPRQLLVGKILGIGVVALAHALVLIVTAYVTTRIVGTEISDGLDPTDLAVGAIWFVLGYALYCSAFAAAGSLVSRVEDAQGVAFPITLPLLVAYFVSFSAAGGVNTVLWVLAFFPPTAVLAMPTLYALGEAPAWAVAVSMALTVAAIVVVALVAAKIYERSVLRTGRRVPWREAFRRAEEATAPAPVPTVRSAAGAGSAGNAGSGRA